MNPTILFALCSAALLAAASAQAADPKSLGVFKDWAAWSLPDAGGTVCYMHTEPQKEAGKYSSRGDTYMQVTHRTKAKTANVVSVIAGYTYKKDSDVTLSIDGKEPIKLFTDGDTAWARDAAADGKAVAAMRAGSKMVVKGTSSRGTLTTDTYSLSGFTAAHNAINKACKVK
jgi:hypothetical protein